jgi:hypothetical protein
METTYSTYSTFVALTSHPVVVLSPDTPVQETEIRGRKSLVFTGEKNPKDYIIGDIQPSGLPVPNVKIIDGETRRFIIKTNDFQVPVIQSLGSTKVIENLPDPLTDIFYITSSFTADVAVSQGRTDVLAPRQLVLILNEDGSTTVLGTMELK